MFQAEFPINLGLHNPDDSPDEEFAEMQEEAQGLELFQYDLDEPHYISPAEPSARGKVFLFSMPHPRTYQSTFEARTNAGMILPTDLSKPEWYRALEGAFDHLANVQILEAIVVEEKHRWYLLDEEGNVTNIQASHIHVGGKVSHDFAHKRVAKRLRDEYNCHGWFSFPGEQWAGVVKYTTVSSRSKRRFSMDANPLLIRCSPNAVLERAGLMIRPATESEDSRMWRNNTLQDLIITRNFKTGDELVSYAKELKVTGEDLSLNEKVLAQNFNADKVVHKSTNQKKNKFQFAFS